MLKYNNSSYLKTKQNCDCDKLSTSYHVASAGCAEDDAAIASMPDQWVPKRSGSILANYLNEREKNHDKILTDITCEAKIVNVNVDSKIRALAEDLLAHIQFNHDQIGCVIESCDEGETALDKDSRDKALKQIYQLHTQRVNEMVHFKREAEVLERERAEGLRVVLRDKFQRLINNGHRPPKDLLHDFDERMFQINQQLLSNIRAYTDLEAQLRVQVDESVGRARSAINQLSLGVSMRSRGCSALLWASEQRRKLRRSTSASIERNREKSITTFGLISDDGEGMNAFVMGLKQAYKSAVKHVFTDVFCILGDLEKDLGDHHCFVNLDTHTCPALDVQQKLNKIVSRLSNSIQIKNVSDQELLELTGTDMLTIQKSLWSLGECLQDTFKVLHDAGHLWDNHILRQALAQKLTIAAVEDLLTSNDGVQMTNEIAFNVALEQLQGSSDTNKLHIQYETLVRMLENTAEMYRIHSEAELSRLEEYMNISTSLAKTLLSEFECFLEMHPRSVSNIINSVNNQGFVSPRITAETLQSPLPRAILKTELQEVALRNWRNGFLETFKNNFFLVPEELRRQARFWVEERDKALQIRFSLKMVSHSVRVERIKMAYEMRLSELSHHEARLNAHLDAISELVECLPKNASVFSSLKAPYLYPFCDWVNSIKINIDALLSAQEPPDPEVKCLKLSSYAPRLIKHRSLFEESVIAAFEGYKRSLEHRIQNARISNVRFMSQIKLFSEGGRYAAEEATKACCALVKGSDALEICLSRISDALNIRRNQLLSEADQMLAPMLHLCSEHAVKKTVVRKK